MLDGMGQMTAMRLQQYQYNATTHQLRHVNATKARVARARPAASGYGGSAASAALEQVLAA